MKKVRGVVECPGIVREETSWRIRVVPEPVMEVAERSGFITKYDTREDWALALVAAFYANRLGSDGWDHFEWFACHNDGTDHFHARPFKGGKEVKYARG